MAVDLVQISFSVPRTVATNVAKRAEPLNIRLSEYARRLFEAAYAARVAQERGESSGDRSLDRQVRDVFLLADCEPEFVADALGMPVIRVRRILDGWRQAVAEALPTPAATPEPTVVAAATRLPPPNRQEGAFGRLLGRPDRRHPRHVARGQGGQGYRRGYRPTGTGIVELGFAAPRYLPEAEGLIHG